MNLGTKKRSNPCKDCKNRCHGCHDKCSSYKTWKVEYDALCKQFRKFKGEMGYYGSYE